VPTMKAHYTWQLFGVLATASVLNSPSALDSSLAIPTTTPPVKSITIFTFSRTNYSL
jgi:hypothetical protein